MLTPHEQYPALAKALGISALYFKREDLHPYGSHKGRSIPKMIEQYLAKGTQHFAISSSGNAAYAAGLYVREYNLKNKNKIKLDIFVGRNINKEKLDSLLKITDPNITIQKVERPLQKLFGVLKNPKVISLRQSKDDSALAGYEELARELSEIPNLQAVFIPTSSGTTAQALGETFSKLNFKIQIHIAQTSFCHPIAEVFGNPPISRPDLDEKNETSSIADAIVDKTAYRKDKVVEIIKKSGGFGWIATDQEILDAQSTALQSTGIVLSPNSALAVAGLQKSLKNGWTFDGTVACLITGR
ncbi:MAG: PLP-dependent lyase/thiolase [Candidatus Taylorbacteria bacterium]